MALNPGTRLGTYEVHGVIGAGGMGQVYRARDTRLNRDVAIKVLPDLFATDADRLARFTREAQTLAALNHANIAQIYGVEESGGVRALVMELVDGQTLAEMLDRLQERDPTSRDWGTSGSEPQRVRSSPGSTPGGSAPRETSRAPRGIDMEEALAIARQIAEALQAAHGQGIIHRDLKPANIKVRPDGTVKVLDFGLAKAMDPAGTSGAGDVANSPTFTRQATELGTIIGTAQYMAPEQARGKPVDKRADIWAFGAVLYEMLTGRPAFDGETVTDILATVVRGDPDWTALPPHTPASIRRLLRRCLTKDHKERLPDLGVARLEIIDATVPAEATASPSGAPPRGHLLARFAWVGALLFGAAATGIVTWVLAPGPPVPRTVHLTMPLPESTEWYGSQGSGITISPDGARIAYLGREPGKPPQLFLRALDEDDTLVVPESEEAYGPFFSSDSRQVGFTRRGKLWRAPVTGGTPFEIGTVDPGDRGTAWGGDGFIYSGGGKGLSRIPESGGTRETLTTVDTASGEVAHRFPALVPGQDAIAFTVYKGALEDARVAIVDLASRKWTLLLDRPGHAPTITPTGRLLYLRGSVLMAVPFDSQRRVIVGSPEPVLTGVRFNNGGAGHYAVSHTGVLTYMSELDFRAQTTSFWAWRDGRTEPTGLPEGTYRDITLSPDGNRLAVLAGERSRSHQSSIAIWDLARSSFSARLQGDGQRESPIWSSDGASLIFTYRTQGVGTVGAPFRQRADGATEPEPLLSDLPEQTSGSSGVFPGSVSSDGRRVFCQVMGRASGIGVLDLTTSSSELIIKETSRDPQISPDGTRLAYEGRSPDGPVVYVRPFPDVNRARWTVSGVGGDRPRWSPDGRELFYVDGLEVRSVAVDVRGDFTGQNPKVVLKSPSPIVGFRVHPDGRRFLLLMETRTARPGPRVVLNWQVAHPAKVAR